jgi:thioredoxin 1
MDEKMKSCSAKGREPKEWANMKKTELKNTFSFYKRKPVSKENFVSLVKLPVFVFFYADWCHFCQQQKPIIDELEQEYDDKIAFIRVNAEENRQASNEFGVTGFPAMFLIMLRGGDN